MFKHFKSLMFVVTANHCKTIIILHTVETLQSTITNRLGLTLTYYMTPRPKRTNVRNFTINLLAYQRHILSMKSYFLFSGINRNMNWTRYVYRHFTQQTILMDFWICICGMNRSLRCWCQILFQDGVPA